MLRYEVLPEAVLDSSVQAPPRRYSSGVLRGEYGSYPHVHV